MGRSLIQSESGIRVGSFVTLVNWKQLYFWKVRDIFKLSLVLSIAVTLSWLALWASSVTGENFNPNGNGTAADSPRTASGAAHTASVADLWVDAITGNDGNKGHSSATAFRTIQKAASMARPGTTVHIQPGVYRESVRPATSGSAAEPISYIAEGGPGTVVLRGSEPTSSLTWIQLSEDTIGLPPGVDPTDIYYTDLSNWTLDDPPRFVAELDGRGEVVARLPLAREPDWQVVTEWKHHEFWWAADGGSTMSNCDPATDPNPRSCDKPSRSTTQLTDRTNDTDPAGVEAGNLTTLGNLTGATLRVLEAVPGHWLYQRTIVAHDVPAGRITVDNPCNTGLGWGSKYYVEGLPHLLDTPGEWWYDENSRRLYLWPRTVGDPVTQNIEISRHDVGFSLEDRSYITLDGLIIEFFNDSTVRLHNGTSDKAYHDTVRNATLRYANHGLWLHQSVRADSPAENIIDGFTLEDSEIGHMDSHAILHRSWWENNAAADSFTRSGIINTNILRNEMHHLGFRGDKSENGSNLHFADRLRFENNHVHDVAHNGVQFARSVIQSPKEYDFEPDEIKTGEILIKDNLFEQACQLSADCSGLKIWGAPPDTHVFRDLLITGNVFRDTFGWTYTAEKRGLWSGGPESELRGLGGFGLYLDYASGIHAYRNIAYNNAHFGFMFTGTWQDGDIVYYDNVVANSLHGLRLWGEDTHGHVNTQLVNNIILNNEGYGISLSSAGDDYGNLLIDHNLYFGNGWRSYVDGGLPQAGDLEIYRSSTSNEYYPKLTDIQTNTPWEAHGVEGDPRFWDYDADDHDLFDGSWPDFHLTADSENALDRGTTILPDSLVALLNKFRVTDFRRQEAYDIGRYEGGFALLTNPVVQYVKPGGVARYTLQLHPPDLPHKVTLSVTSPSPDLTATLSSPVLAPDAAVTLTVTDKGADPLLPGRFYTVPITASGGGFTETASVDLLVGGTSVYLPFILLNDAGHRVIAVWQPLGLLPLWWLVI